MRYLIVIALVVLVGCQPISKTSTTRVYDPAGNLVSESQSATAKGPVFSSDPSSANLNDRGEVSVKAGGTPEQNQATAGFITNVRILSLVLVIAGVGLIVAGNMIPFVSAWTGWAVLASGGGMLMLPTLLDYVMTYLPWVLLGGAGIWAIDWFNSERMAKVGERRAKA